MNAVEFQNAIRIIYCMGKREFTDCFGHERAPYLWSKFQETYDGNPADFICYLDINNITTLHTYLQDKNQEQNINGIFEQGIAMLKRKFPEAFGAEQRDTTKE